MVTAVTVTNGPVLTISHDGYLAMVLIDKLSTNFIADNHVHLWAKDVCGCSAKAEPPKACA